MSILITGGAGYIGSHIAHELARNGEQVVVLDDFRTGFRQSVQGVPNIAIAVYSLEDVDALVQLFESLSVDTVIHCAASSSVPDSVANPLKYYRNNVETTRILLEACTKSGIRNFIFSSSASVYGEVPGRKVSELDRPNPVNPYGRSKLVCEWMIKDICEVSGMRYVNFRYFNVIGAALSGLIGQSGKNASHLIKVACEVATGKRDHISIYGNGTAQRDYVDVEDLASAHRLAVDYLRGKGSPITMNLGYGIGRSVLEVLSEVQMAAGADLKIAMLEPRDGDPHSVVAEVSRIHKVLGWKPTHHSLRYSIKRVIDWERKQSLNPW